MTLRDAAFRHVPHLKGRILDPLTSRFRHLDYPTLDRYAAQIGQPADWRRTDEEREATRHAALTGHMGEDLWVFAYGSLMWDPGFLFDEVRIAHLNGFQRRFCLQTDIGRGSPEAPGLMAALDDGGSCEGLAFRISAPLVEEETCIIWRREMIMPGYVPTFVPLNTAQGDVEGLAFVIDHGNRRYLSGLDPNEAAHMIAQGQGHLGSNIEYLENLSRQLELLGLSDPAFDDMYRRARSLRQAAE